MHGFAGHLKSLSSIKSQASIGFYGEFPWNATLKVSINYSH